MKLKRLFMDQDIDRTPEVEYLISKLKLEPELVSDPRQVYDCVNASDDPVSEGKTMLHITRNQGAVVRECPGTSHYTCCDYTILHTGTFCTMDCSYCILQAYFHPPVLQYFAGLDLLDSHLNQTFAQDKIFRIGTGEYTDSLIWERVSQQPKHLVQQFAKQSNSLLELKSKTVNIDSLLDLDHNGKTVLSWSVNTPAVIKSEERSTAPLKSRLAAARKAQQKGYRLAFHFDPLVIYPGCEADYRQVIHDIFSHVDSRDIVWISMGSFRFMPNLKAMVEQRFTDSCICYGEFILGLDNKMRYFKPLRIALYKELISLIREYDPNVLVYFCMEDEEVWEKSMGIYPAGEGELGRWLDQSAVSHCGLNSKLL